MPTGAVEPHNPKVHQADDEVQDFFVLQADPSPQVYR
jgi:hypothetical protein